VSDACNRLTAITGIASFAYDTFAAGRRRRARHATSFLYDGWDVAQEQQAARRAPTSRSGLVSTSALRATAPTFLTDALGSTTALASAGAVQTSYGYDPYGVCPDHRHRFRQSIPVTPAARTTAAACCTIATGITAQPGRASSPKTRSGSAEATSPLPVRQERSIAAVGSLGSLPVLWRRRGPRADQSRDGADARHDAERPDTGKPEMQTPTVRGDGGGGGSRAGSLGVACRVNQMAIIRRTRQPRGRTHNRDKDGQRWCWTTDKVLRSIRMLAARTGFHSSAPIGVLARVLPLQEQTIDQDEHFIRLSVRGHVRLFARRPRRRPGVRLRNDSARAAP